LLSRLAGNEVVLRDAYVLITDAVQRGRQITPAAEWFIDNYHLIEEQIRTARRHLPRAYHRELPRLANAPAPGTPRVYHIALELISHAHGRVDAEGLRAFVASYQEIQPLRLGELWAIPIMLRLALLENLRRVVMAVTAGRHDRELARGWVGLGWSGVSAANDRHVVLRARRAHRGRPAADQCVRRSSRRRLRRQGAGARVPMSWLEQRARRVGADRRGTSSTWRLRARRPTRSSIGNTIAACASSARPTGATSSRIDERRRAHSRATTDYATMDFATRDRYRHVVETRSRGGAPRRSTVARRDPTREEVNSTSRSWLLRSTRPSRRRARGAHRVGTSSRRSAGQRATLRLRMAARSRS
jgi:hypothetical protein